MQTGLEEMKAAGVLCRSLQRAVCVESPRLVPGKGGASDGLSSALVHLGSAPGGSCPPAVVLKAAQCRRAHLWELSRASFDQKKKSLGAFVFHRALLIFAHSSRMHARLGSFSLCVSPGVALAAVCVFFPLLCARSLES